MRHQASSSRRRHPRLSSQFLLFVVSAFLRLCFDVVTHRNYLLISQQICAVLGAEAGGAGDKDGDETAASDKTAADNDAVENDEKSTNGDGASSAKDGDEGGEDDSAKKASDGGDDENTEDKGSSSAPSGDSTTTEESTSKDNKEDATNTKADDGNDNAGGGEDKKADEPEDSAAGSSEKGDSTSEKGESSDHTRVPAGDASSSAAPSESEDQKKESSGGSTSGSTSDSSAGSTTSSSTTPTAGTKIDEEQSSSSEKTTDESTTGKKDATVDSGSSSTSSSMASDGSTASASDGTTTGTKSSSAGKNSSPVDDAATPEDDSATSSSSIRRFVESPSGDEEDTKSKSGVNARRSSSTTSPPEGSQEEGRVTTSSEAVASRRVPPPASRENDERQIGAGEDLLRYPVEQVLDGNQPDADEEATMLAQPDYTAGEKCVDGTFCRGYSHGCNDGFCLTHAGTCRECPCEVDTAQVKEWKRQKMVDVRVVASPNDPAKKYGDYCYGAIEPGTVCDNWRCANGRVSGRRRVYRTVPLGGSMAPASTSTSVDAGGVVEIDAASSSPAVSSVATIQTAFEVVEGSVLRCQAGRWQPLAEVCNSDSIAGIDHAEQPLVLQTGPEALARAMRMSTTTTSTTTSLGVEATQAATCTIDLKDGCPNLMLFIAHDVGSSGTRSKALLRCGEEDRVLTGEGCVHTSRDILQPCKNADEPAQCDALAESLVLRLAEGFVVENSDKYKADAVSTGVIPIHAVGYATAGGRLRHENPNEIFANYEKSVMKLNKKGEKDGYAFVIRDSQHMRVLHGWEEAKLETRAEKNNHIFSFGGASAQFTFEVPRTQLSDDSHERKHMKNLCQRWSVEFTQDGGASSKENKNSKESDKKVVEDETTSSDSKENEEKEKNEKSSTTTSAAVQLVQEDQDESDQNKDKEDKEKDDKASAEEEKKSSTTTTTSSTSSSSSTSTSSSTDSTTEEDVCAFLDKAETLPAAVEGLIALHPLQDAKIACGNQEVSSTKFLHIVDEPGEDQTEESGKTILYASFLAQQQGTGQMCHVHSGENKQLADAKVAEEEDLPPCAERKLDSPSEQRGSGYYHLAGGFEGARGVFLRWGEKCFAQPDFAKAELKPKLCACGWGLQAKKAREVCDQGGPPSKEDAESAALLCLQAMVIFNMWDDEVLFLAELLGALAELGKMGPDFRAAGSIAATFGTPGWKPAAAMRPVLERVGWVYGADGDLGDEEKTTKFLRDPDVLLAAEKGPVLPEEPKGGGNFIQLIWRGLGAALGIKIGGREVRHWAYRPCLGLVPYADTDYEQLEKSVKSDLEMWDSGKVVMSGCHRLFGKIGYASSWLPGIGNDFPPPGDEVERE
ncbi:unnamed protein product [Amoebophrya sp. A120]|nr:unnamed protein product [Amoebophrya sp. A120]|eukprot:GSA120T00000410001.1